MIDFEWMRIDRGSLSDVELFNVLQALSISGDFDNPMARTTRRAIKSGNRSVTREHYELKEGWSYK